MFCFVARSLFRNLDLPIYVLFRLTGFQACRDLGFDQILQIRLLHINEYLTITHGSWLTTD